MSNWQPIETAPKKEPFWLASDNGGVLLEAWHWCAEVNEPRGFFSRTTLTELKKSAPGARLLWLAIRSPENRK
jgi:hypothetical protein